MSLPKKLAEKSEKFNEDRDCSVKAVAIVCNASYEEAHAALKKAGRKNRKGANMPMIVAAIRSLGAYIEFEGLEADKHKGTNQRKCPVSRIASRLPKKGRFLALTCNHIVAVVDGEVLDWTEGRRHQVKFTWEVSL